MFTRLSHAPRFSLLIPSNFKTNVVSQTPSRDSEILEHCRSGSLSEVLRLLNSSDSTQISSKPIVYASLLQTCTKFQSFSHGLQLHAHLIKSALETDRFVGNSLLALYFKLGSHFPDTRRVFDGLFVKDVVSWSSMISGYIRVGKPRSSICLFVEMLDSEVEPNEFTLSAVIKACSELGDAKAGRCFHGVVFRRGFDLDHVIASSLIDMYGRNLDSRSARELFEEMLIPDAICWTSVISALTRNDLFGEALEFFYSMQRIYGLLPDIFTFGTVLTACGNLGRLRQGKQVHARVITEGMCGNVVVESSLVDMYGKCGLVDESWQVFDRMSQKNTVSWCALLGGYCQKGDFNRVIELFREHDEANDLYSLGTVLRACAGLAAVRQGKEVHCHYLRKGGWRDVIVESALVDLYAKCGCIDFAFRIFKLMPVRNLITWNSMICGFAQNGRGREALGMFYEMVKDGIRPDNISFIGVLFACSHTGLTDEGRELFTSMNEEYGIKAGIEHYACMVGLLGRAGQIEEAENLIQNTEFENDSTLWAALLDACSTSMNSVVAERIAKKMMELDPGYHLSYVLLANVYRAVGRWNDALNIWRLMEERGVRKMPGTSWIENEKGSGYSVGMNNLAMSP
ncbi:hypothetical protein NMG60_11035542 [Bertholletia excelsa]